MRLSPAYRQSRKVTSSFTIVDAIPGAAIPSMRQPFSALAQLFLGAFAVGADLMQFIPTSLAGMQGNRKQFFVCHVAN